MPIIQDVSGLEVIKPSNMVTIKVPSRIHSSGFYPNPELYYVKQGVELHEYKMHKYVYNLGIVNIPKIINYDKTQKTMVMQKINGTNLSDFYGEDESNISNALFAEIRGMIKVLYEHNIQYIDITGYNFVLDSKEKLWIIDFEHCEYNFTKPNPFVQEFCNGANKWNPYFK